MDVTITFKHRGGDTLFWNNLCCAFLQHILHFWQAEHWSSTFQANITMVSNILHEFTVPFSYLLNQKKKAALCKIGGSALSMPIGKPHWIDRKRTYELLRSVEPVEGTFLWEHPTLKHQLGTKLLLHLCIKFSLIMICIIFQQTIWLYIIVHIALSSKLPSLDDFGAKAVPFFGCTKEYFWVTSNVKLFIFNIVPFQYIYKDW